MAAPQGGHLFQILKKSPLSQIGEINGNAGLS
jgi:hypothetical protein